MIKNIYNPSFMFFDDADTNEEDHSIYFMNDRYSPLQNKGRANKSQEQARRNRVNIEIQDQYLSKGEYEKSLNSRKYSQNQTLTATKFYQNNDSSLNSTIHNESTSSNGGGRGNGLDH